MQDASPAESETILPVDIVRCPDGKVGQVTRRIGDEAHVVHDDQRLGRGPWIFPVADLKLASADDADAYRDRCKAVVAAG